MGRLSGQSEDATGPRERRPHHTGKKRVKAAGLHRGDASISPAASWYAAGMQPRPDNAGIL